MAEHNEIQVKYANCYGKEVIGCQRHDAFAMIGISHAKETNRFTDLFFADSESLAELRDQINKILKSATGE